MKIIKIKNIIFPFFSRASGEKKKKKEKTAVFPKVLNQSITRWNKDDYFGIRMIIFYFIFLNYDFLLGLFVALKRTDFQ